MQVADTNTRTMKPLLALVIIMGVLIVVGVVVVIATIVNRMSGGNATADSAALTPFAAVDLPIPPGCEVKETTATDDRLILRLGSGERCNQLLIVELATGRLLGTLKLVPNAQ